MCCWPLLLQRCRWGQCSSILSYHYWRTMPILWWAVLRSTLPQVRSSIYLVCMDFDSSHATQSLANRVLTYSLVTTTGSIARSPAPVLTIHPTICYKAGTVKLGTIPTLLATPTPFFSAAATVVKEVATGRWTVFNENSTKSFKSWTISSRSTEITRGADSERAAVTSPSLITNLATQLTLPGSQLKSMNLLMTSGAFKTSCVRTVVTMGVPVSNKFLTVSPSSLDLICRL